MARRAHRRSLLRTQYVSDQGKRVDPQMGARDDYA